MKKPFYIQFLRPIAEVYALITDIRNGLYNSGRLKAQSVDIPLISVGNLSVGGTGKSPMVAYLVALLKNDFRLGVISRGYGRKACKYIAVQEDSTAKEVGDEPLMLKQKFPEVSVSVDVKRAAGIAQMKAENPHLNAIILDDAFQHRSVKPGLNILLTVWDDLYVDDFVLPAGRLRERRINAKRADIIVVTKCPSNFSLYERKIIVGKIHPLAFQQIYFSTVKYLDLMPFFVPKKAISKSCLLVTGIADGQHLEEHLRAKFSNFSALHFGDHHRFSNADLGKIRQQFNSLGTEEAIVVTTEKDATRLLPYRDWFEQNKIAVYVQPISVDFLEDDGKKFDAAVLRFLNTFAAEKVQLK